MTSQDLKYSILKLAFSGKIVEQSGSDSPIEKSAFSVDEPPFDIPDKWKWNYIGEVCEMYTGDSIAEEVKKTLYQGRKDGLDYIGTKDVQFNHEICYNNGVRIPSEDSSFKRAYKDCILMCIEGGSAGRKIGILDREVCFGNKLCMFHALKIYNKYIYYYLQSSEFKNIFADNISGIIGGVSIKKMKKILIPIPPVEEQKRIVDKIESILPLILRYDEVWSELESLNNQFPIDIEKSILEYALKGKLVEQRHNGDTGADLLENIEKYKKRNKIKDKKTNPTIDYDAVPFEIPETWAWCRLGSISTYAETKVKVIAKNIKDNEWSLDLEDIEKETGRIVSFCLAKDRAITGEKTRFKKGQILYSKLRPYLKKILIAPENGVCTPELVPFDLYGEINAKYIMYVLKSPHVDYAINSVTYGSKMPRVGTETMTNLLIPLPPIEEQARIVSKIEELIPICRKLIR